MAVKKAITIQIPDFFGFQIPVQGQPGRQAALENLHWVLGCWELAVRDTHQANTPRRHEVVRQLENIAREIKPHLSDSEWAKFSFYLVNDDCTVDSARTADMPGMADQDE